MRLRNVKGAKELIQSHPQQILDNQENTLINLESLFPTTQPIHLEIGMGKGQFIYELARLHPNINYIGMERFDSVIVRALEKVLDQPLSNLYLIRADAQDILELLPQHSIAQMYLNFSDPWPKDRHAKRRLTSPNFLRIYHKLLSKNGEIHFKTDNPILFEYSFQTMMNYPMDVILVDKDLHSHKNCDNIMTEFEAKFVEEGKPIHKIIARFKEEHDG